MKIWTLLLILSVAAAALSQDAQHLGSDEVTAALAAPPNSGFVYIEDAGLVIPTLCAVQMPSESVFTPTGWLKALAIGAKQQYKDFKPAEADTLRVLRVVSKGCVNGTPAGPICDTIDRVVLLSDASGTAKLEALSQSTLPQSWQNGFGATATCSGLVSLFPMDELAKVRNGKGQFLIATFSGGTLLKIYTVKEKHLKKLGI